MKLNQTVEEITKGHQSKALLTKDEGFLKKVNNGKETVIISEKERNELIKKNIKPIF